MIIENISALKVQKLSQDQFDNARENNTLDNNSIYLTPTVVKDYALKSDLKEKADLIDGKIPLEQLPDDVVSNDVDLSGYYTKPETDSALSSKADLVDGKIPTEQLPDDIGGGVETWDELEGKPLIDFEVIENSENLITSGGVYTAIQNTSPNLTFDTEPTEGSTNLVNSGSLYSVIGNIDLVIDYIDALIGGETE